MSRCVLRISMMNAPFIDWGLTLVMSCGNLAFVEQLGEISRSKKRSHWLFGCRSVTDTASWRGVKCMKFVEVRFS